MGAEEGSGSGEEPDGRIVAYTELLDNETASFTPRHNGKVERHHRTLADELGYARAWNNEAERRDALRRWLIHFS